MTTIHLFRHGQTESNLAGRIQGHQNAPLTELGIQQAIDARQKIDGITFDVVLSSPSGRAVHTADLLIDGASYPMQTYEGLREIYLGDWEGWLIEDIMQSHPEQFELFWSAPSRFVGGNGESFARLKERAIACLQEILSHHAGKTILVVSHAAFIKTLLTHLMGKGDDEVWHEPMANNLCHSIIRCDLNGKVWVEKLCDIELEG